MKNYLFLFLAFFVFSCHQPTKQFTIEEAETEVTALPMVQKKAKQIEEMTNGKHGISFISDSTIIEGKPFYQITAGYNSNVRFETYYIFYVNKANKNDIRILEPVSGEIIPVSEYKK